MNTRTGGCLCGQVRYSITAEPGPSRICWCRDCQHLAANGTVNVVFPTAAIEVTGNVARHNKTADSGNQVTRSFCPECGSHLFSDSTGRPGLTVVRVGTLDAPDHLPPDIHIFTASKQPWVVLPPGIPAVEEYYEREGLWPAQSIARRQAVLPRIQAYRAAAGLDPA